MKVYELIHILQTYPEEMRVVLYEPGYEDYYLVNKNHMEVIVRGKITNDDDEKVPYDKTSSQEYLCIHIW